MTKKMTDVQRDAILRAHRDRTGYNLIGVIYAAPRTLRALHANRWAQGFDDLPTRAGLIAAGVDMDELHADALAEDEAPRVARRGAIVQRRGEVGPRYPLGRVLGVAPGNRGPMVKVSWNGLVGLWADSGYFISIDRDAAHTEALECVARAQDSAAAGPAHVRDDCPALTVGGCMRCTAPATVRAVRGDYSAYVDSTAGTHLFWPGPMPDFCRYLYVNGAGFERLCGLGPNHPVHATTPAEARTGISDRAAAALADVAALRDWVRGDEHLGEAGAYAALDRIEAALRERA